MSVILQQLFDLAMEQIPCSHNPAVAQAEVALEDFLGQKGKPLLDAYNEAMDGYCWETAKNVFYIALSLGIELGRLGVN